jgi:hypothetical protein
MSAGMAGPGVLVVRVPLSSFRRHPQHGTCATALLPMRPKQLTGGPVALPTSPKAPLQCPQVVEAPARIRRHTLNPIVLGWTIDANDGGAIMASQDDYVAEAKAQLDKWNAELKKMQGEAEKMTADAQAQFKTQMDAMEAQRQQAVEQLEKMGKANMAAWQDMQSSFQSAWKSMEKGMEDARKRYMKG